jgi:SAM-dependent methyltransferase
MLKLAREKAANQGYGSDLIEFRNIDAESLPFRDASFDVVITGMTLGLLPDQAKAVKEMARVLRPGGQAAVGAHGPEHYWEACDASFRAINKRYVLGYRLEFWPRKEKQVRHLLEQAGLVDIRTRRLTWQNSFKNGGNAYDFFAAISSSWWYAKFPREKIAEDSRKTRNYFERKRVTQITDDVILAYGRKPRDLA